MVSGMVSPASPVQLNEFVSAVFDRNYGRCASLDLILECVASMALLQQQKPVWLNNLCLMSIRAEVAQCFAHLPTSFLSSICSLFASSNEPLLLAILQDVFGRSLLGAPTEEKLDLFSVAVNALVVAAASYDVFTEQCLYAYEHGDMFPDQSRVLILLLLLQQGSPKVERDRIYAVLASFGSWPAEWCTHPFLAIVALELSDFLSWCSHNVSSLSLWSRSLIGSLCSCMPQCAAQIIQALIARVCDDETPIDTKLNALCSLAEFRGLASFLELLYSAVASNSIFAERLVRLAVPCLLNAPVSGRAWLNLFQKMLYGPHLASKFAAARGIVLLLMSQNCDGLLFPAAIDWVLKQGMNSVLAHFFLCLVEEMSLQRPCEEVLSSKSFLCVFSFMLDGCEALLAGNVVNLKSLEHEQNDFWRNLLLATRLCIAFRFLKNMSWLVC